MGKGSKSIPPIYFILPRMSPSWGTVVASIEMIESPARSMISPNLDQFLPLYRKYPITMKKIPNITGRSIAGCEKIMVEYIDASTSTKPNNIDSEETKVTTIGTL